jgi:dipeptidase
MAASLTVIFLAGLVVCGSVAFSKECACEEEPFEMCTAGGVGMNATADGSIITFQSADCGVCDPRLLYVPAADHQPGEMRVLRIVPQVSGGGPIEEVIEATPYAIPEVAHTYAYFKGVFGHMNEHQLGISESTRGAVGAVNNPEGLFCVTELSMIAMERCTTAREAVALMGELAEKYGFHGYSAGEMLFVSDTKEVWIWEIYRPGPLWSPDAATGMDPTGRLGCAWVAQRVPDNQICVMPNLPRIGEVDLNDSDNFMASANLFSLAEELGLWDSGSGVPFDARFAYGNKNASARLWNLYRILAPSQFGDMPFSDDLRDYPFSFVPDKKLSALDIAQLFRDSAEGTEFDNTVGLAAGPWGNPQHYGATRLAPTPRTEYTDITQSRSWLPDPIGGILWWGVDNGHTGVFVPLHVGITEVPESYAIGSHHEFTRDSAWWAFNFVNNWATINWANMYPVIKELRDDIEGAQMAFLPTIEAEALAIYQRGGGAVDCASKCDTKCRKGQGSKCYERCYNRCSYRNGPRAEQQAREYLTAYCVDNAELVVSAWWDLADYLMCNYDDGIYPQVDGQRPMPSQEWLDACFPEQ